MRRAFSARGRPACIRPIGALFITSSISLSHVPQREGNGMPESGSSSSRLTAELARTLRRLNDSLPKKPGESVDHPVNENVAPTLTIGIATYDDFDGAYFTVTSLLMHHRRAMERCEIVILDNHPQGHEAASLRALALEYAAPPVRYLPYTDRRSTAVCDAIFPLARTPWVMVLDGHVLLEPGAVDALLDYIDAEPDSPNLIQGPMVKADGEVAATHMNPGFHGDFFGVWGRDERIDDPECEPFEIPLHGLALFAMNVSRWPGFNQRFTGFGGGEGYIHEKVRQAGGVTLCLPRLRWHHRFSRPNGVPYPMSYSDRVNNYLAGWREIGRDTGEVHRAFSAHLGDLQYHPVRAEVERRQDHPGAATIVCIASDDDRVGPWRKVLASAEAQGLEIERMAASRAELGDRWWGEILERVAEAAHRRRWTSVTVIDERLDLPASFFYRLLAISAEAPGHVIRGSLQGDTVLVMVPEGVGGLTEALASPSRVRDILLDAVPEPGLLTPDRIESAWTINAAEDGDDWLASYGRWAIAGMGTTMNRLPALADVAPELQHAYGFADALQKAATIQTPTIVALSAIRVSEDAGPVLSDVLRELEGIHWDVVSLSTDEPDEPDGRDEPDEPGASLGAGAFCRSTTEPDAAAVLVSREGVAKLAKLLPEPALDRLDDWQAWREQWKSLEGWLAARAAEGVVTAFATSPVLAVTTETWKRVRLAHAGRMRR